MTDMQRFKKALEEESKLILSSSERLHAMAQAIPDEAAPDPDPPITQANHGFQVRDIVRQDPLERAWVKDPDGDFAVTVVIDRNTFRVSEREVTTDPGPDPDPDPDPTPEPGPPVGEIVTYTDESLSPWRETVVPHQVRIAETQDARVVTRDREGAPAAIHYRYPKGAGEFTEEIPLMQVHPRPVNMRSGLSMELVHRHGIGHPLVLMNTLYANQGQLGATYLDYYRFSGDTLCVFFEEDCRTNGITIVDVFISNGARMPNDEDGTGVDGDVFFDELAFLVPDGKTLVLPYDKPGMGERVGNRVLVRKSKGPNNLGYLGIQMNWEIKVAVCDPVLTAEAVQLLQHEHRDQARGVASYWSQKGGFGPQLMCLMDMDEAAFKEDASTWGLMAENEKSRREMGRLHSEIANDINDAGILNTRGQTEGNEPGGWEIQWGQASWHLAKSHSVWELQHMEWTTRAFGGLFHAETGKPLSIYDFVRPDGKQPWTVNRTNRAEDKPTSRMPWPRQVGSVWNDGQSEDKIPQDRFAFLDHSHSCRWNHGLKYRIWNQGSVMAQLIAYAAFNHYQFDPSLYDAPPGSYGNGKTVPGFERTAPPGMGHGALGRQMGWVLDLLGVAWACDLDWADFRNQNQEYVQRLGAALNRLVSPAGGTRRRLSQTYGGSPWSWASPRPPLPDTSPLICDQVFEVTYMAIGALGVYQQTGDVNFREIFERIGANLCAEGKPLYSKWVAYGKVKKNAQNQTVLDELFTELQDLPENSTGRPHMVNLCAMMWRHTQDEQYFRQACRWLGAQPSYEDAILKSMPEFRGEIHDWRLLDYWNAEGLIAQAQLAKAASAS